jgi:hypothetical protein
MEKTQEKTTEQGGAQDVQVIPATETHMSHETEIVPEATVPSAYMLPNLAQINEYETFLKNYDAFVGRMLNKGTDFDEIPGTDKPTLLKPGAEKLEKLFFFRHKKECVLKEVKSDGSFIRYTYRTTIFNKSGQVVSTCEGTCNSHEKKYRFTTKFDNECTEEEKKAGEKQERKSKRNGSKYTVYVIEKKDFYDMENTIMKMAQKRSYVGAILEATNSSGRFTQDMEDMNPQDRGERAPDEKPPKQEKGVSPAMFEKVKKSIMEMDDVNALEELKGKISKSDKYTDPQKKELVELIGETAKAIKK